MNRQSRRTFLALFPAFALAACAGSTTTTPVADYLQTDVALIVGAVPGIIGMLQSLPPGQQPSAAVMAQIQTYIDDLKANAAAIGSAVAPNQAAIGQVGTIVTAIAGLASPFFGPAPLIGEVINAALSLIPGILAVVNKPAPAAATRAATKLQPAQARLILKANAH